MTSPIGLSLKRKEDERLLRGRGRYTDDVRVPDAVHLAIVRSPHAHARVNGVDARAALALPGVLAVFTLADLPECGGAAVPPLVPSPLLRAYTHPALAGPTTRFAGEAVAVVAAGNPYVAADAVDAVAVDYTPLDVASSVERANAAGDARVFTEWPDNLAGVTTTAVGDAARGFAEADAVVAIDVAFPRVAGMPIEPRAVTATPPAHDGTITMWTSTQVPFAVRTAVARALRVSEERVRVLAPDVGGGFGIKGHVYPEDVIVPAVARKLGRAVRWVETRREHFLSAAPDRDQRHRARLGVRRDGVITAIETEGTRDHGAYPMLGDAISMNSVNHLPGPYRVPNYRATLANVVTHKTFAAAYRGAGRPEAAFVLDRLLDRAARRIGMDPAALRRRNMIRPDEMPYRTGLTYRDGVAIVYDPADYVGAFDRALGLLDYDAWRDEQKRRRGTALPIGIGLSAYVEGTGIGPFEGADVRIDPSGTVYVMLGVSSQGQAHETTLAQIAAAELGVDIAQVVVVGGDTGVVGYGMGTIASRVAAVAGPAIAQSARDVARKTKIVAAEKLECAPEDVVLSGGRAHVAGMADRMVTFAQLARASIRSVALRREGAPGLHACTFFYPGTVTWACGAHAGVVEVDVETGAVRLLKYVAVHDCGRPINPMVVEGQLHGGIAQGIGTALFEELVHDGQGQLLTGTLMDYGLPRADLMPPLDTEALDHPSSINELGIQGVGESGVISPSAVIGGAVEDALADHDAEVTRVPLTAARVWELSRST
jgi:carbon-monoxide dehydrogenase large subunit